mmetsp:Transcript_22817/g.76625  ORF Transcript_22817/g.76625 Transcript_22817/m.76625 type:complete len:252 (+) Transcript_22817:242-997(+)
MLIIARRSRSICTLAWSCATACSAGEGTTVDPPGAAPPAAPSVESRGCGVAPGPISTTPSSPLTARQSWSTCRRSMAPMVASAASPSSPPACWSPSAPRARARSRGRCWGKRARGTSTSVTAPAQVDRVLTWRTRSARSGRSTAHRACICAASSGLRRKNPSRALYALSCAPTGVCPAPSSTATRPARALASRSAWKPWPRRCLRAPPPGSAAATVAAADCLAPKSSSSAPTMLSVGTRGWPPKRAAPGMQ